MPLPQRMRFGIFLGPFHKPNENPTLSLERDLELVQHLDNLGYDEAWIGEHHSAGWETIASPEIFIAAVAERTRNIKLGTGVISLPYHHPLMVAERLVMLDHLTRGRVMFGVGPGALPSDAHMLGIDPSTQRTRMDEALGVILRLFKESDPLSYRSDWFALQDAVLQIRPFQHPHMPIAVASVQSPSGVALAGKHGASVLSMSLLPKDLNAEGLHNMWSIAEESATLHGKNIKRADWRIVVPIYVAETRTAAFEEARKGAGVFQREYLENTLGRSSEFNGPMDDIIEYMVEKGLWIVGTPDDCISGILRLNEASGGFGCLLVHSHEWASREKLLKSYELIARYVFPYFQGSLIGLERSVRWTQSNLENALEMRRLSIDKAKNDWTNRE